MTLSYSIFHTRMQAHDDGLEDGEWRLPEEQPTKVWYLTLFFSCIGRLLHTFAKGLSSSK